MLAIGLGLGLTGCVTTGLPVATASPWQAVPLETSSNPLAVAFSDASHGFLVGSNRLIMETDDGGASWQTRSLDLPEDENFRLISIDFNGDERIAASTDAFRNSTGLNPTLIARMKPMAIAGTPNAEVMMSA